MNANIGMLCPVAATVQTYTPGTSISYNTGKVVAEARAATLAWNRANGRFYGDDVELDSDNSILGYTLDFEPSGLKDDVRAYLIGETVQTGEYTVNDAVAPDVGFGYVRVMRTTNTSGVVETSYEGWWFYKLRFGISNEETRTKEESVEWRTPTLNGVGSGVRLDSSGKLAFATHKTFASATDAMSYVKSKAGIS